MTASGAVFPMSFPVAFGASGPGPVAQATSSASMGAPSPASAYLGPTMIPGASAGMLPPSGERPNLSQWAQGMGITVGAGFWGETIAGHDGAIAAGLTAAAAIYYKTRRL